MSRFAAIGFAILVILALLFGEKVAEKSILFDALPRDVRMWKNSILEASEKTGVPPEIIAAVIWQESGGRADAVGASGEVGLMQVKKRAVTDVNRTFGTDFYIDGLTPWKNILAGSYYLKIQRENHSNWDEALEAYNQGARGRTLSGRKPLAESYRNNVNEKIALIT